MSLVMSQNPLLLTDTLSVIVIWTNQYPNTYDTKITKICLKSTCKFLLGKVGINKDAKKDFFRILTLSTINNQDIFKWFYNQSYYCDVWTSYYSIKTVDLTLLDSCL